MTTSKLEPLLTEIEIALRKESCPSENIQWAIERINRAQAEIEKGNPVPSSTELIAMANLEWHNREERRGIHNREDWCCGWMAGFLTEKKPNWAKEQIEAAKSSARKEMAKTLSEILDREWMCDLNEIKYIMDCVANGNTDPFKDRPEKGVEK